MYTRPLSDYSKGWNQFLYEEVERIIHLAVEDIIPYVALDVLSDIGLANMYENDKSTYVKIIEFCIRLFGPQQSDPELNLQLLDIMDWYLVELDVDDNIPETLLFGLMPFLYWLMRVHYSDQN